MSLPDIVTPFFWSLSLIHKKKNKVVYLCSFILPKLLIPTSDYVCKTLWLFLKNNSRNKNSYFFRKGITWSDEGNGRDKSES